MIGAKMVSGFVDPAGNYIKLACFLVEAERDSWMEIQRQLDPTVSITTYANLHGLWAQAIVAQKVEPH